MKQFKSIGVRLVMAFLLPVVLVTATLYPIFQLHLEERVESKRAAARALLKAEHGALVQDMNESLNHALAITEFPSLQRFFENAQQTPSPYQQQAIEGEEEQLDVLFDTLMTHFGRYARITLLDRSGRERLTNDRSEGSVEHKPEPFDTNFLQLALSLPARNLYVSPPYTVTSAPGPEVQPVLIDLAAPVFGREGQRLGVLLLTLDWRRLMAALPHAMGPDAQVILVDANGMSLMPGSGDSVSFGSPLAEQLPEVWEAMAEQGQGEVGLNDQVVVFQTHDMRFHHYRSRAEKVLSQKGSQPWRLGVIAPRPGFYQLLSENPVQLIVLVLVYGMAIAFAVFWVFSNQHQRSLRKSAQALSSEASEYARELYDLYENAPCGYHALDKTGLITKVNRMELNWLGYEADEVIGKRYYRDFVTPETRNAFDSAFQDVLGESHEGSAECELQCRDGSTLPVAIEATAQIINGSFQYSRAMVFDLTERKQLEELLRNQSVTDPLTGLGNRRYLESQAEIEMARAKRSDKPLCLIAMDLDNFKRINDSYGHDVGDLVLQAFAETALKQLREGDVLCRIGGEEFTLLLPETAEEQALGIAERLRDVIANTPADIGGRETLAYTTSLGVTRVRPAESSIKNAIKRADRALYQAKDSGRNQVRLDSTVDLPASN